MHIKFTNCDSTGLPITRRLVVVYEGERHVIDVALTGTAQVPRALGEFLVEHEAYAVDEHASESKTDEEPDDESESDADSDEN